MRVLVVSPHPDDETLGAGGTILKHKEMGDRIYWLIITNIDTENGWEKGIVERRQMEIKIVAEMYGFERIFKLDFPTTKLDIIPIRHLIKSISNVILGIKPEIYICLTFLMPIRIIRLHSKRFTVAARISGVFFYQEDINVRNIV